MMRDGTQLTNYGLWIGNQFAENSTTTKEKGWWILQLETLSRTVI